MPKYRRQLPQLSDRLFLTDGGLETTLIFHEGIELPYFASFDLLRSKLGPARLREYYERYIAIAKRIGAGFVLEGVTWRASPDWAKKIGYSLAELAIANRAAVDLMVRLRNAHESERMPMVISANIGPRGDGYKVENAMSVAEAEDYHGWQVSIFRDTEADLVSAFTINYVEEGIGVARACRKAGKYVGICGQGPSDHPDLARWLMEQGIDSMSLNPDTVVSTWMSLAEAPAAKKSAAA